MLVTMIGCGKLGAPCANVMARKGHIVYGVDPNPQPTEFPVFPDLESARAQIEASDFVFIAVPTPHDPAYGGEQPTSHLPPKDFDYTILRNVLEELQEFDMAGVPVVISTVLPGTYLYEALYNPYLIAMGSVEWDMVNPDLLIIGADSGQTHLRDKLERFYRTIMENDPPYVKVGVREAQCVKIFYNTYITTKLNTVNAIMDACDAVEADVDVVIDALKSAGKRITGKAYMTPGMGDAGACHPRDLIALSHFSGAYGITYDYFGVMAKVREDQAAHIALAILQYAAMVDKSTIYIHGRTYKPNVPYTEGSYSELIAHYLREYSQENPVDIVYVDPFTDPRDEPMTNGVIFFAHHAPTTYAISRVIGSETQGLYAPIGGGCYGFDIWRNPDLLSLVQNGTLRGIRHHGKPYSEEL